MPTSRKKNYRKNLYIKGGCQISLLIISKFKRILLLFPMKLLENLWLSDNVRGIVVNKFTQVLISIA